MHIYIIRIRRSVKSKKISPILGKTISIIYYKVGFNLTVLRNLGQKKNCAPTQFGI